MSKIENYVVSKIVNHFNIELELWQYLTSHPWNNHGEHQHLKQHKQFKKSELSH
jgi:hypothetical protein